MNFVQACRICLTTNNKLLTTFRSSLNDYYEVLINDTISNKILLRYMCYECAVLLKKFYEFREKSLRSQIALNNIKLVHGKVTEKLINEINRSDYMLESGLTMCFLHNIECVDNSSVETDKNNFEPNEALPSLNKEQTNDDVSPKKQFVTPNKVDNDKTRISDCDTNQINGCDTFGVVENDYTRINDCDKTEINDVDKFEVDIDIINVFPEEVVHSYTEEEPEILKESKNTVQKHKSKMKSLFEELFMMPLKKKKIEVKSSKKPSDKSIKSKKEIDKHFDFEILTPEEQYAEINKRKESSNYKYSFYKCDLCFKGYLDNNTFLNHLKTHIVGEMQCDLCKTMFSRRQMLINHIRSHMYRYKCKLCSHVVTYLQHAKEHISWHDGVVYTCHVCGKQFGKRMTFFTHLRTTHPSDVVCGLCGHTYVSKRGLYYHKLQAHKGVDEDVAIASSAEARFCSQCKVYFVSELAFKRHLVTVKNHQQDTSDKFGCQGCGEWFDTKQELQTHIHNSPACTKQELYSDEKLSLYKKQPGPKKCLVCEREFENVSKLRGHYQRLHRDHVYPARRDWVCETCGKMYTRRWHLRWHQRVHTHEKDFTCQECGKVLSSKTSLQSHLAVHSGARPYVCERCPMAFKCRQALNRHIKTHTGEKPYDCPHCDKCFSQSSSYHKHVRGVHHRLPPLYARKPRKRTKKMANGDSEQYQIEFQNYVMETQ